MHPEAHGELRRFSERAGAIGNALLFPHPRQEQRPDQPVSRHLAAWWLKEAFRRGKLQKPDGSLWHTFRRVLATERKHLPPNDAAGGWLATGVQVARDSYLLSIGARLPAPKCPLLPGETVAETVAVPRESGRMTVGL